MKVKVSIIDANQAFTAFTWEEAIQDLQSYERENKPLVDSPNRLR